MPAPFYYFKCNRRCGRYPVKPETFKKFILPNQWDELQGKIKNGAIAGVLSFHDKCPRCDDYDGRFSVSVGVLQPAVRPPKELSS